MQDLGIAAVVVRHLSGLPGQRKDAKIYDFDVSAFNWEAIASSPYLKPLLMEAIIDDNAGFAVCHPSKRKFWIDNFIVKKYGATPSGDTPSISWTAITKDYLSGSGVSSIFADIIKDFPDYDLIQPDTYVEEEVFRAGEYIGPKWADAVLPGMPPPDDLKTLGGWATFIKHSLTSAGGASASSGVADVASAIADAISGVAPGLADAAAAAAGFAEKIPTINYVNQEVVKDGLYWGIESSDFLTENMPFWVTFKRMDSPATSRNETAIVISIGPDHETDAYDLYISNDKKPQLIDYYGGKQNEEPPRSEFDVELSKIFSQDKEIEIGFLTVAGRLVIFVNKIPLVYTRIERDNPNAGSLKEAKIPAGKIRIWATNVKAAINVSPMSFAPIGIMAIPIPSLGSEDADEIEFKGVSSDGDLSGTIAELPQEPEKPGKLHGVDCKTFNGPGGTSSPYGFGFHKEGQCVIAPIGSLPIEIAKNTEAYFCILESENVKFLDDFTITSGGAPYFFRLKGAANIVPIGTPIAATPLNDVLSVSESASADDYFHIKKGATIVLYNENGRYDFLKDSQEVIDISWGWNAQVQKTFTGLVVNTTSSEVAGKETLEVRCEDSMYCLKNQVIMNSPFFDGMLAKSAIEVLVNRAGFFHVESNFQGDDLLYFLPSGYVFTKPKMRYKDNQKLFECVIDMTKRFEAVVYFDENDTFHIDKLPGGLLSEGASELVKAEFTRDPSSPNVILDEKNVEQSFVNTVSGITIKTVMRDTRDMVIEGRSASSFGINILKFKSWFYLFQPALGGVEAARQYLNLLAQRIFYPIRKTSFKTVGNVNIVKPLDFITLDGLEYRVLSIQRSFNADTNDFTNSYSCEWLGGK